MRVLIERKAIFLRQIFSRKFDYLLFGAVLSHLLYFYATFGSNVPLTALID